MRRAERRPDASGLLRIARADQLASGGIFHESFTRAACRFRLHGLTRQDTRRLTVDFTSLSGRNAAGLNVLLSQFGQTVTPGSGADFNGDGLVNGADLSVLLGRFGQAC